MLTLNALVLVGAMAAIAVVTRWRVLWDCTHSRWSSL